MQTSSINFNQPPPSKKDGTPQAIIKKAKIEATPQIYPHAKNTFEQGVVDPAGAGHNEAIKETTRRVEENQQKLDQLVVQAQKNLYKITSQFPFDLFPDELTIFPSFINVITKNFGSVNRQSIPAYDLADSTVHLAIYFGALTIKIKDVEEPITLIKLKKSEAKRAQRIIQGLILANRNNIDLTKIDIDQLTEKLEQLGTQEE